MKTLLDRLRRMYRKIVSMAIDLLCSPTMINAYVYFDGNGSVEHRNWGDDVNYFFISLLAGRKISIYSNSSIAMRLKRDNYLCIGSTLNYLANAESIVWGSGVISEELELPVEQLDVRAVRGPLTRTYLEQRGIACPEIYGDPVLLLPYFYQPKPGATRYRLGIIPHYVGPGQPEP